MRVQTVRKRVYSMKSALSTEKLTPPQNSPDKITKVSPRGSRSNSSSYRYVYCIIPAEHAPDIPDVTGIDDAGIRVMTRKKIGAVISDTGANRHEILDNGVVHQQVVEEIQKRSPLLPMGFGQISTEASILSFLEKNNYRLVMMMNQYSGKKELVLKASLKMDNVLKELSSSDDQIRILSNHINQNTSGENHRMKIKIGRKVADSLERMNDNIGGEFLKKLKPFSERVKINKNLNREMFLNAAFLVNKNYEDKFDTAVDELEARYHEIVSLSYIESAPYDFISLRM